MKIEGISLGWNCSPAQDGIELGLRKIKEQGYQTGPFDMMVSNYIGLCQCIEDDFKYFCDTDYLELRKGPKASLHFPNQNDEEFWIYNTRYNFIFNHEAPGHGNLYLAEGWVGGINHFVENNFENFVARYNRRIDNFRRYLNESDYINFIMNRYNSIPYEIVDIIKVKYPNLKFKVNTIVNFGSLNTVNLLNRTLQGAINYETDYMRYMNVDESELLRYYKDYSFANEKFENENIRIIET